MTIYDIMKKNGEDEWEYTCWDTDYDMEFYLYYEPEEKDNFDKGMMALARHLEVESINCGYELKVTEFVEKWLKVDAFRNLWIVPELDDIMDDWEAVMSGNAADGWYAELAKVLNNN